MAVITGTELHEFSTFFWNTCNGIPDWKNEDLSLFGSIPSDKLTKFSALDLSYSSNPEEKPIVIVDNSSFWKQKVMFFSSHHLFGELDVRFQYHVSEIYKIELAGELDTEEFGSLYINDHFVGKLTFKNVQCAAALKEFFRKLTVNDISIDPIKIKHTIDPKSASPFLMELSNLGYPYAVLNLLRDDAIDGEKIVSNFNVIVLTTARVIAKSVKVAIRYENISNVTITSKVEHAEHPHIHPPHKLGIVEVGAFLTTAYLRRKEFDAKDKVIYSIDFFVSDKMKLHVFSSAREFPLNIFEVLKKFHVKGEIHI